MDTTAPYYQELARGPTGIAHHIRTMDGVRLRVTRWNGTGTRGTVFLFQGMGDYAEKYAPAAQAMVARGYGMITLDWRGQGLSQRLHPTCVHANNYTDYAIDAAALIDAGRDLPRPWYVMAHSMGGAIALRRLMANHPFSAVAFCAPMWHLHAPGVVGRAILRAARITGRGCMMPLLYPRAPYAFSASFRRNILTSNAEMWVDLIRHADKAPDLAHFGPTLGWAIASDAECRALEPLQSPDLPCIAYVGSDEKLAGTPAIRDRMARWPRGRFEMIDGARHELMRERPEIQERFFYACERLFQP